MRCERLTGGSFAIGVTFRDLPLDLYDHIQDLVAAALERRRTAAPATVLVVDEAPNTRQAVARDLGSADKRVLGASTPLEVVRHLADVRIEAALVEARFADANGLAILACIADEHPSVRRILVAECARARDYEREVHSGRVHAFLTKPWERQCQVAALTA